MSIDLNRYSHLHTFVQDETLPLCHFKQRTHYFPDFVPPLPHPKACSLRWIMYNMDKVTSPFLVKTCERFTCAEIAPDTEILIIGKTLYGSDRVAIVGVPYIDTKFCTDSTTVFVLDTVAFYPMWISCRKEEVMSIDLPLLWMSTVSLRVLSQTERPKPCVRCTPQRKCSHCHRENMICDRCGHGKVVTEFLYDSMLCELCNNELVQ